MPTQNANHVHQIVINVKTHQHVQFVHWIILLTLKEDVQLNLHSAKVDCINLMDIALMYVLWDISPIHNQISVNYVLKTAGNAQVQQYVQHVFLH